MNFHDWTIALGENRHLVLAGGGRAWAWLAAGAVALGLVLALYRYERRLVSRSTGLALLSLRVIAALALVATLFEPIAARTTRETVRGRVILGVDLSESMATADPVPPSEDRRTSPSEPIATVTRREVARRLLDGPWLKTIARDHAIEAVGFARDAVDGSPESLAAALKTPGKPDDPAMLATDWAPALDLATKGGDPAPVLGVILLTDGRPNATGDPGRGADRLAARGIPIYPIMIGATTPPKDAAIAAIKAPDGVFKGDTASVEVIVKVDGVPGVEVPVTLSRPGGATLRKLVRGQADGTRPVVIFRVPMDAVGPQVLSVAVGPIFGDARPDNDKRSVTVQVADDKAKVLLVDGEARWEFRYLRNALARDPRVSVDSVIFRQPKADPNSGSAAYADALPKKPDPPRAGTAPKADPLGAYDAIVVGDVDPSSMPPDAWARLDSYVAERGGTLILLPGPRGWPGPLLANEAVRKLLPVLAPKLASIDANATDPAHPSLPPGAAILPVSTASAEAWPMLQMASDPERSRAIWAGLPRLPWALVGRAKPGATVLASIAGETPASDSAVIAAQPYGLGKVLWVGTDATWRWRHRVGDAYHHRFWGQVVRWAASGKLAAGNALVRFGPDRPKLPEGDAPRLNARFAEGVEGIGPDLLLVARVFKAKPGATPPQAEGEAVAVVPMHPVAGQPRAFAASAPALAAGSYLVRLDAPQIADALKSEGAAPEATLEIVPRLTPERVELSAARDPLERLASATGGKVFTPLDADALAPLLLSRTVVKTHTDESPLWDRPWALALFFGVLTVEWVLRKRSGLP